MKSKTQKNSCGAIFLAFSYKMGRLSGSKQKIYCKWPYLHIFDSLYMSMHVWDGLRKPEILSSPLVLGFIGPLRDRPLIHTFFFFLRKKQILSDPPTPLFYLRGPFLITHAPTSIWFLCIQKTYKLLDNPLGHGHLIFWFSIYFSSHFWRVGGTVK